MNTSLLELSVSDCALANLKNIITHSSLDFPRPKQVLSGRLAFSGWVLKKESVDEISILIRNGPAVFTIKPDVKRYDVLSKVLKISESAIEGHSLLVCGFSKEIVVDHSHNISIYFMSGGVEYLWKEIKYKDFEFDVERFEKIWSVFVSDDVSLAGAEAKAASDYLEEIGASVVNEVIFNKVISAGVEQFIQSNDSEYQPGIKRFFDYVTSPDFCVRAVQTAISQGSILVPDPFGYGFSACRQSYSVPGNINILKFTSSSGEVFYILQHVSSADAVFFPSRKYVALIKHLPMQSVKSAFGRLFDNFKRVIASSSSKNKFVGLIASHGRPYHFYYDVAPAINDLNTAGLLSQVENILYYQGGDFCSFADVYGAAARELVDGPVSLWDWQIKNFGYSFHAGVLFDSSRVVNAVNFDHELLSYSRSQYDYDADKDLRAITECYPLIWFGVTVQKRAWVEQVDAAVKILNKLHEKYPRLGVIFDGWTSPLNITEGDLRETKNDNLVCNEIAKQLSKGIKVHSVVGAVSYKKVVYSRLVDVHVGNSATGGLHVARFCGRPGVAHLNTKLIDSDEHIRYGTHLVEKKFIVDRPEDIDLRSDFISYSIDWRVVYDGVVSILGRA